MFINCPIHSILHSFAFIFQATSAVRKMHGCCNSFHRVNWSCTSMYKTFGETVFRGSILFHYSGRIWYLLSVIFTISEYQNGTTHGTFISKCSGQCLPNTLGEFICKRYMSSNPYLDVYIFILILVLCM